MADVRIEGIDELIADLTRAESRAPREVHAIVKRAAQNLKDELNQKLSSSRHFKAAGGTVTYDEKVSIGAFSAEVGPDKSIGAGALGNLAFFGASGWSGSHSGGTVDLDGPVRAEAARFNTQLGKLAGGLL